MSFIETGNPDFYAVAWNEDVTPPVCVIVGELGTILYSVGREYSDGFRIYTLAQPDDVATYNTIFDIDYGNGIFMAACAGGLILTSETAEAWTVRETGDSESLFGITHISAGIWVAVGQQGGIWRTGNNGLNWSKMTTPGGANLNAVHHANDIVLAVGDNSYWLRSTDAGLTWVEYDPPLGDIAFRDLTYAYGHFYFAGAKSTILKTELGVDYEIIATPTEADFNGIAFSGGLIVAIGDDASTITSVGGEIFDAAVSGIEGADFLGIGFGDNRFVMVGEDNLVAYSATGTARPAFENFRPISDQYRAQCFTQFGAYMLYGGILAFEEGQWNYYPRRILNPAPGTVDDFESQGWFFADLPGSGYLLDMVSVRGGIVVAESGQLSLLTDAGSLTAPWMYHQNFGEGLRPISNLTSFNGVAYGVMDDGLIYTATNTGVSRLQGFFDLTEFEDWKPDDEAVWLGFDAIYQMLFVFRQKTPWTIFLVNDQTGGVSEMAIPELKIDGVSYEPRSAFIINGLHDGIHVGYAATEGKAADMVTARLDLVGPITGIDEPTAGTTSRHRGDIQTGSFRLTALGARGDINEVLVRTWADPDATVRPDIAVLVREECEDDWQTDDQPHGRIVVFDGSVWGDDTAWSRYIVRGDTEYEINVTVPELVFQAIDVEIVHQVIAPDVPEIVFEMLDTEIITGQDDVKVNVPGLIFEMIDPKVIYTRTIDVNVPEIAFQAIDCQIDRMGFYELPWLVDQCDIFREDINGNRTPATYTKTGPRKILLDTPLEKFESLYVNPGPARPFVLGRTGDYIFTEYGAHRIINVPTASEVELDWYPPEQVEGFYVPAQEIPEGGCGGDGKLVFGLGRGFDQIMIQVLIIPHGAVDATGAKITKLELGYRPTGPEMKTDAGGRNA